jgi:hypothetical protein
MHGCVKLGDPQNRRFEFQKRSQLFIRVHNETLSVVAMAVNDPDYSPVGGAAQTPTGFAEIISDKLCSTAFTHGIVPFSLPT